MYSLHFVSIPTPVQK